MRLHAALALACLLLAPAARVASPHPRVADWAWNATDSGATAPVLVLLSERADLAGAATLADRLDRRRFVHLALLTTAQRSQAPLRALLDARGVEHRAFFVANAIALRADRQLLLELARRPEVERVVGDPLVSPHLPEPDGGPVPKAAQWNVALIGAPVLWAEGHWGDGIVVGVQDTGIRWTHEAIRGKYRGFDPDTGLASHDYNWRDAVHAGGNGGACGVDAPAPCDDNGHGTHVTGTIAGGDPDADGLGVAPLARWIGCRNMDRGWGSPSTYFECFEFFLAPTPVGGGPGTGDPDLAPDVTSNS